MITFKNKCITIIEEIHIIFNYGSPSKNSKTRACMKHHENSTITALKSVCVCVCVYVFEFYDRPRDDFTRGNYNLMGIRSLLKDYVDLRPNKKGFLN